MVHHTWLTTKEAAEYMRVHPETLRTLIRKNEIQAVKVGGTWRLKAQWCDDFLMEGTNA